MGKGDRLKSIETETVFMLDGDGLDKIYLNIPKPLIDGFVANVLKGAANCKKTDTTLSGMTIILPGKSTKMNPQIKAIFQGYLARDKGIN